MSRGIPVSVKVRTRLRRILPLLVWLGAGAVALHLYSRRIAGVTIIGLAAEVGYDVGATIPGRVRDLEVGVDDQVAAGQVIARLDDHELGLTLREAMLELRRLASELERERGLWSEDHLRSRGDKLADLRRFARDAESTRIAWLDSKAQQSEDRILLQGLDLRLGRTRGLSEAQVATIGRLDDDRTQRDAVFERIARREPVLAGLEARYEAAQRRYEEFKRHWDGDDANAERIVKPFQFAIDVQQMRIEKVNLSITRLVLKAPAPGKIAEILKRPGEIVAIGEPVVRLVESEPREVVGWVPEHRLLEFRAGDKVQLLRRADPSTRIDTLVSSRGGRVEAIPLRLTNGVSRFGFPVRFTLPRDFAAVPGEVFEIVKLAAR